MILLDIVTGKTLFIHERSSLHEGLYEVKMPYWVTSVSSVLDIPKAQWKLTGRGTKLIPGLAENTYYIDSVTVLVAIPEERQDEAFAQSLIDKILNNT